MNLPKRDGASFVHASELSAGMQSAADAAEAEKVGPPPVLFGNTAFLSLAANPSTPLMLFRQTQYLALLRRQTKRGCMTASSACCVSWPLIALETTSRTR